MGTAAALGPRHAGASTRAEYAVRWDPAQGGPATPQEALRGLGLGGGKRSAFDIRYFQVKPPADLPAGFDAILRQRSRADQSEWTFKLRGAAPLPPQPSLQQWHCPLGSSTDRKDEVDLSFVDAQRVHRAYSRSCEIESRHGPNQLPSALEARPKGCANQVTRLSAGKLKVEEWRLADGSRLIEASRPGRDDAESLAAFRQQVLQPLLSLGIRPLERSKSAIAVDCSN